MLFLRDFCDSSSVLKVVQFLGALVNILRFVVPIGLIVMVSIDIAKNVIINDSEDMQKNSKIAAKRIFMAIIIFFIPTIVDFANSLVVDGLDESVNLSYVDCLENANSTYISKMEAEEEIEREEEEKQRQEQIVGDMESDDPYIQGGGSNLNGLPEGDEFYPLDAKGEDGEKFDYLEVDGHFLSDSEMKELSDFISESVNSSDDWGTRVALAGWALAYGLSEKGLMMHYQKEGWGTDRSVRATLGKKQDCDSAGYCENWGRKFPGKTNSSTSVCSYGGYINFQGDCSPRKDYYYAGVDCTGFVTWANYTGCGANSHYQNAGVGEATTNYEEAEPGDVFANGAHSILFLKRNEDGTYMTVESSSGGAAGLFFHKYTEEQLSPYTLTKLRDVWKEVCTK